MKHKRLVIVVLICVGLVGAWMLHQNWHRIFPTTQMKQLRQLEATLGLPKPKYRNEVDLGYYKDSKGAPHYDRHIALSYADVSVFGNLQRKLLGDSWAEKGTEEPAETSTKHFFFTKGTGDEMQCINGYIDMSDRNAPLYISLEASGEYSCNPVPGI